MGNCAGSCSAMHKNDRHKSEEQLKIALGLNSNIQTTPSTFVYFVLHVPCFKDVFSCMVLVVIELMTCLWMLIIKPTTVVSHQDR